MKFLLAGNLANHAYFLAKLLRKNDFKTDLLIGKNLHITEDPKALDKDLIDYPEWIKFYDTRESNWHLNIIKTMRKYDLIQSSTELPIFSYLSRKRNIAFTTGADVVKLANERSVKGFLMNRSYKKSKIVIFPSPYLYKYVKKQKIKKSIFLPLLWDYKKFQINNIPNKNETFTIFHPTNHVWNYKKNHKFLKAFVKLANENKNIKLIMIKRGPDVNQSIKILEGCITKNQVEILPETLPQSELVNYYNKADVVVDQFGVGSTGLIGQEVMASGKPLMQYIDNELYEKFYSEKPPILNALTEEEIYTKLSEIINDPSLGKTIGEKSQTWILKHHNHENIIKKYIYLYNSINDNIKFEKIKEELHSF